MPPITVTGTELEYTVDGLSPNVTYIVKCISSNGVDSCDSSVDMIRRKFSIVHRNYSQYLYNCINEIIQIQYHYMLMLLRIYNIKFIAVFRGLLINFPWIAIFYPLSDLLPLNL